MPYKSLIAQQVQVLQPVYATKTSWYDIKKLKNEQIWLVGKDAAVAVLDADLHAIEIPAPPIPDHVNLLHIDAFDNDNIIIAADEGYLLQYRVSTKKWNVQRLNGYENFCFYNVLAINDSTAFIGGGNSKIATGKKALPNGEILVTKDGGKSWKTIYRNQFRMVWELQQSPVSGEVFSLSYSPIGSYINKFNKTTGKVDRKSIYSSPYLLHRFLPQQDGTWLMAGGKSKNFHTTAGVVIDGNDTDFFNRSGMIWSIVKHNRYTVATCSHGKFFYKKHGENSWKTSEAPAKTNLYKAIFVDDSKALIAGSDGILLLIDFSEPDPPVLNSRSENGK